MNAPVIARPSIRLRGRSLLALVLAPEAPVEAWLEGLDDLVQRSPGFFIKRPTVLDVSALTLDKAGLADLLRALDQRDVRVLGIEGARASLRMPGMPPLLTAATASESVSAEIEPTAEPAAETPARKPMPAPRGIQAVAPAPAPVPEPPAAVIRPVSAEPTSLVVDGNVRSGQLINFQAGDVTVIGSIASGAEVIAAGSIHVYGTIRGRAVAGSMGRANARIFCSRLEAELLAIDGLYQTADRMDPQLRNRPVQAWVESDSFMISALG